MATSDCEHVRRLWSALPPQRIRIDLDLAAVLAAVRDDYGLSPGQPVGSSERLVAP